MNLLRVQDNSRLTQFALGILLIALVFSIEIVTEALVGTLIPM